MIFSFALNPIEFRTSVRYAVAFGSWPRSWFQTVTAMPFTPACWISFFAFARLYGYRVCFLYCGYVGGRMFSVGFARPPYTRTSAWRRMAELTRCRTRTSLDGVTPVFM